MENFILLVDSHHGIYMAQSAMELLLDMNGVELNIPDEDMQVLLDGPDNDQYVEVSSDAFDETVVTIEGIKYNISWNEDLWLVRDDIPEEEYEEWNR